MTSVPQWEITEADIWREAYDALPSQPDTYVTEISVPDPGDGGVQRLHNHLKEPEGEPEEESAASLPEPEA